MPRPNPPRRKPRQRRRNPNVVRVPQQPPEQEVAQSQTTAPPPPRSARAAVRAGTPAPAALDTSEWTRRSMYILVGLMAVTYAFVNLLIFTFSKSSGSIGLAMVYPLNAYAALAAAYLAMPVAKWLTGEARYLRVVETALVSIFVVFLWFFLITAAGAVLSGTGNVVVTHSSVPKPVTGSSPGATPTPSTGSFSASPSASGSSGGSSNSSTLTVLRETPTTYTVLVAVYLASFGITPLIFYPLYRRFRLRRRLTQPPQKPAKK